MDVVFSGNLGMIESISLGRQFGKLYPRSLGPYSFRMMIIGATLEMSAITKNLFRLNSIKAM